MAVIHLSPHEEVRERPFTGLHHTRQDVQALRYMVTCVHLTLDCHMPGSTVAEPCPLLLHQPPGDEWVLRLVITQPERLRVHKPLTVVGFFGLKSDRADVALAQQLDRQLVDELTGHTELLAYVSLCLPTGNFANAVLFASWQGKEDWGRSESHSRAVRLLTPNYYTAVRLYNGELPGGVAASETLCLRLVKYFDYGAQPLWRAVRPLSDGVAL